MRRRRIVIRAEIFKPQTRGANTQGMESIRFLNECPFGAARPFFLHANPLRFQDSDGAVPAPLGHHEAHHHETVCLLAARRHPRRRDLRRARRELARTADHRAHRPARHAGRRTDPARRAQDAVRPSAEHRMARRTVQPAHVRRAAGRRRERPQAFLIHPIVAGRA
ncbi:hypothetical protein BCEN4_970011 [Burkholderia cenocepacia]|nr:hypothetical protein BCEN4_970011 [Burkholderia cenocepacia]